MGCEGKESLGTSEGEEDMERGGGEGMGCVGGCCVGGEEYLRALVGAGWWVRCVEGELGILMGEFVVG
ncbi:MULTISPECIES: hypothetical protein [Bartonella]|uniref:hypothetical protein n=1 Tax=Bartonella TaxID=773 RepID=UPI001ABCAA91|nr:hypothetical protein [Bartonella capreoli]